MVRRRRRPVPGARAPLAQHAPKGRAVGRFSVRRQHELDRQLEQRAESFGDVLTRDVLATPELDFESGSVEVREGVAGDDRVDGREPEDEIVVLATRVRLEAERPRAGTVKFSLTFACPQPREILTLHSAYLLRVHTELLDPVLPGVGRRRVHRKAESAGV